MSSYSSVDIILVPPSEAQLRLIKNEFNEDEDRLRHAENLLHEWINCHPYFPKKYDRRFTRNFLRNCKNNLDKTKTKLECYFTAKHLYPELFSNRSTASEDIAQAMETLNIVPLPQLTENGNRIIILKLEDTDPLKFDVNATSKLFFMIYDLMLTSEHPAAGDIAIFDGADIGPHHFIKFLAIVKMITAILREAYAIRLKQIHIINASPIIDKIINVIKPLLHYKVRNTFINHTSSKSLCSYFSEEILPSNYGGKYKDLRELMKDWQETLKNNSDWFFEQEDVKITEAIPKTLKNNLYSNKFSIDGSFRTLQID